MVRTINMLKKINNLTKFLFGSTICPSCVCREFTLSLIGLSFVIIILLTLLVIIILFSVVKGKLKSRRELESTSESQRHEGQTAQYEEINLHYSHPTTIDTRNNVAYAGFVSNPL